VLKIILFTSEHRKSNTTGKQTEEKRKTVSEGTRNCKVFNAARCDWKLLIKRIKRWHFILFVIKQANWDYGNWFNWKRKCVCCNFSWVLDWLTVWFEGMEKLFLWKGRNKVFFTSFERKGRKLHFTLHSSFILNCLSIMNK